MTWAIMPVMGGAELTRAAIADVLSQSAPMKLLIVNQGCPTEMRQEWERLAEQDDRVFVWSHMPPLPSLSSTWNRALNFVWELGEDEAFVVNNDVRLRPQAVEVLSTVRQHEEAWFVSAVGVTEDDWQHLPDDPTDASWFSITSRGGPDFSCFLLSKRGHRVHPFDEHFIPAYCEDLDLHRRYMLNGDGDKIFSINLPYWHVGSGTLKSMTAEQRAKHEARIGQSRAYYQKKWGGPVNQERYTIPFDASTDQDHVTTPELQHGPEAEDL